MKNNRIVHFSIWMGLSFLFLLLIQWGTDIQLIRATDLRQAVILILGTLILFVLSYRKKQRYQILRNSIQFNLFLVGTLMSVLNLLSLLGEKDSLISIQRMITCIKPLIYSIILYLPIINILKGQMNAGSPEETFNPPQSLKGEFAVRETETKTPIHHLDLSRREKEVIQLLFKELSNKEISELLFIQESTVKKHLQNIYRKAQCEDRIELMKHYIL